VASSFAIGSPLRTRWPAWTCVRSMRPVNDDGMIRDTFDVTMPTNSGRSGGGSGGATLVPIVRSGSAGGLSVPPHAAASGSSTRGTIADDGRVIQRVLQWVVLRSLDEPGVQPAVGEELLVGALLDDATLVHH